MHEREHSPVGIIVKRSVGFILFLIILLIANMLVSTVNNSIYNNAIGFFNVNVLLFFSMFFWGLISEIFWNLGLLANMFAPIASAILSTYVVAFFYRVWLFIEGYTHTGAYIPIVPIYIAIFIIVIVAGYARVAVMRGHENFWSREEWDEWKKEKEDVKKKIHDSKKKSKKERIEWDEVGEEFKLALYNLGDAINRAFDRHKSRKRRKKD
jgi:cellulose synthase/poly-beta-1,6-N-acetylglucosamine synthase-like glycosyltransferase